MPIKKTIEDIKSLKIQGAQNIALAGIKEIKNSLENGIYKDEKDLINKLISHSNRLISARPTEPTLRNALKKILKNVKNNKRGFEHIKNLLLKRTNEIILFFNDSDKKISEIGAKKIKDKQIIYTHCHSSTVMKILKKAKLKGKRFELHNTETRPLYQGRKTSKEMSKIGVKTHHYIDSAMKTAIKKTDIILLGCDAILSTGEIVNKIGTGIVVDIAEKYDIPVYICTNTLKFDPETINGYEEKIEKRTKEEVWPNHPKEIIIHNPSFDLIDAHMITGIISEIGIYESNIFIEEILNENPWMIKKNNI